MTINLSDNNPRVSYAVAQGVTQTSFTVSFEFFDNDDLNVYVDGTLKTITTHYTVSGGSGSTGTVTMSVTGATGGSTVVITRDIDLDRTTDFPSSGPFNIGSLNTELDRIIAIQADLDDLAARSLHLADYDTAVSVELPVVDTRKGTVLAFNASTGAVEVGPKIADVSTLAAVTADIATLADIEDGTDATDAIQTVAGISSNVSTVAGISSAVSTVAADGTDIGVVSGISANVTTVAGISSNVTTVAGISADVTTVAADGTDIGTVAGISANVTTVAGISSNVTSVAGISANVTTVAGINSDVATLADIEDGTIATNAISGLAAISSNVTTVAGISSNVTTVAGISANVTTVAGDTTNIGTIATNLGGTDTIGTVATSIANVNTVGGSIANVNTVASNLSAVNSFANLYRISASAPTTSLDIGDLYFNTSTDSLQVYTSSGWQAGVTAGSGFLATTGGSLSGDLSGTNITLSGYLRGPSSFTIDPATHGDNTGTVVIAGNLQVDGTTTTINSTTLTVDDKNIVIASGAANAAAANGSGITVDGASATLTYNSTGDNWEFNKPINLGTWTITESGGSLYFAVSGTNKMKLDGSGNLDVVGNVNTNATIS